MDKRPDLNKIISIKDFKEFYWLKKELINFCRLMDLSTSGGKLEITERIEYYLESGNKRNAREKLKFKSTFDWKSEKLSLNTTITDNYKNTENVRSFFEKQIGESFKFNVRFMNWMKSNEGRTLQDAIAQYEKIKTEKKNHSNKKEIASQFEYNTYLRDFLSDNPNSMRAVGIKLWKIKRSMRGDNSYNKSDLNLIEQK